MKIEKEISKKRAFENENCFGWLHNILNNKIRSGSWPGTVVVSQYKVAKTLKKQIIIALRK
jgi:hypothetical protein